MQYRAAKWFSTFVALLFLGFLTAAPHAAAQAPTLTSPASLATIRRPRCSTELYRRLGFL